MACKLPSTSASAETDAALVEAATSPTLVTPSDLHLGLIATVVEDQSILESVAQDVVDVVFSSSIADESGDGEHKCVSHLLMEIAEAPEVPDFLPSGPSATELGYEVVAVRFSEDLESWEPDHVYEVLEGEEDIVGQAHEDEGDNIFMDMGDVFDCWA